MARTTASAARFAALRWAWRRPILTVTAAVVVTTCVFFVWFALVPIQSWAWTLAVVTIDVALAGLLVRLRRYDEVNLEDFEWQMAIAGIAVALFPLLTVATLYIQILAIS